MHAPTPDRSGPAGADERPAHPDAPPTRSQMLAGDARALDAPCRRACPVDKDVPGFLRAIAKQDLETAWEIVRRDNLLPRILGHVCPHPCEAACSAGDDPDGALPVCRLKLLVARLGLPEPAIARAARDAPRVAVVGAGPAGLAAAHDLNRFGYRVTLRDCAAQPGGIPASGIPAFRLPRRAVAADVEALLRGSVEFEGGRSLSEADILALRDGGYAATVVATGRGRDREPDVASWRRTPVTWTAIEFLDAFGRDEVRLPAGRCLVIGGGNAALDAARSALRAGARSVRILYRRRREDMPALEHEIAGAEADGVRIHDRSVVSELKWRGDQLVGCRCHRTRVRTAPPEWPEILRDNEIDRRDRSEHFCSAGSIIFAIGQEGGLDERALHQPAMGRFVCGDLAGTKATVVDAIASGRRVAAEVARHLRAHGLPGRPAPVVPINESHVLESIRASLPPILARVAGSCRSCDHVLDLDTERCVLCGQCAMRCTDDCLRWESHGDRWRLVVRDASCLRCGVCVAGCPTGALNWNRCQRPNRLLDPALWISVPRDGDSSSGWDGGGSRS